MITIIACIIFALILGEPIDLNTPAGIIAVLVVLFCCFLDISIISGGRK